MTIRIGNGVGWGRVTMASTPVVNQAFEFTVKTDNAGTSADNQFTIPTSGTGYNYDIVTSDGQTITGNTGNTTITFSVAGTYDIKITGDFPAIRFDNTGDRLKLTNIKNWGSIIWTNFNGAFRGCSNLTISATDIPNVSAVADYYFAFENCTSLTGNIDLSGWDLSNVVRNAYMFSGCNQITSIDTSSFGTSNSIYSDGFCLNCTSLTTVTFPIGYKPSSTRNMFKSVVNMVEIVNIESWDTTSLGLSTYMFQNTPFNQDISGWDVSNVTDMNNMFYGAVAFNQDISGWNTSSVTNMSTMFYNAQAFNQPIGSWDVSSVTNFGSTFTNATSFNQDLSAWIFSPSLSGLSYTFQNAINFNNGGQPLTWDISNFTSMSNAFYAASSFNADISSWAGNSVQNWDATFRLTALDQNINNIITSSATTLSATFRDTSSFTNGGVPLNLDTSNVTNMNYTFGTSLLVNQISGLDSFEVENVTSGAGFIQNPRALTTANYDATLISWESKLQALYPGGVGYTNTPLFDFGASKYTLGGEVEAARTSLINTFGWTITDGGGVAQAPFVFTVNASSFTVPTNSSTYTYNYDISTSDGQVIPGNTGDTTITFPSSGTYTIEITGTFPAIRFNNGTERLKITDVTSWGTIVWKSFSRAFFGCNNLTVSATDAPYIFYPMGFDRIFENCQSLDIPNAANWNVSNVINFIFAFNDCIVFNRDISGWDVSNSTSFQGMFGNTTGLNMAFNQPIGSWDVSNTVGSNVFRDMFYGCTDFDQDLSAWNISGLPFATGNFNNFITSGNLVTQPVGLSRDNYDALLIGWAAQAPTQGEIISFGTSQYTLGGAAEAGRNILINTYGWTITDGGGI